MTTSTARRTLPYGEWPSPITVEDAAAASGRLSAPAPVGAETWWCASDPRTATVQLLRSDAATAEPVPVLPEGWRVRNRSMGYGGRAYLVVPGQDRHLLVFTDHRDQRLYRAEVAALGRRPSPTVQPTPAHPGRLPRRRDLLRGSMVLGPGGDEVWCVREIDPQRHRPGGRRPGRAHLRASSSPSRWTGRRPDDASAVRVVAGSHHFLSGARVSPDGREARLGRLGPPRMPWETDRPDGRRAGEGVAVRPRRGPRRQEVAFRRPSGPRRRPLRHGRSRRLGESARIDLAATASPRCVNVLPLERECAGAVWKVDATWFAVTPLGVVLSARRRRPANRPVGSDDRRAA